jgi:hypothetical protein
VRIKIGGFLSLGYAVTPMNKGIFTFRRKLLSLSSRVLEVLMDDSLGHNVITQKIEISKYTTKKELADTVTTFYSKAVFH